LNKLNFVKIDESQLLERVEVVTVQNTMAEKLRTEQEEINKIADTAVKQQRQNEVDAKKILINMLPSFNANASVKKIDDFTKPEVKQQVMEAVRQELYTGQLNVFAERIVMEADFVYEKLITDYKNNIIEIPRMDLVQNEIQVSFDDFNLDIANFSYTQLNDEILRIGLKDKSYDVIEVKSGVNFGNPEKLLIAELMNFSEIDYDTNADLLHKLASQAVTELQTNLKNGEDIRKLVFQWRRLMADRIYIQMMRHFHLHESEYIKPNVKPFTRIEEWNFGVLRTEGYKDYREDNFPAIQVPKYVFRGFEKSCHFEYKFDSRTEQTLSYILENDTSVIKWLRPAPNQFRIYWQHNSKLYEPDFIAETKDCIYMIEAKAANEMNDADVKEKATAALKYCNYAAEFTAEHGGKPWKYALIPHDKIAKNSSFIGVSSANIIR
jgi:type III restriction enzyme